MLRFGRRESTRCDFYIRMGSGMPTMNEYEKNGYVLFEGFYTEVELRCVRQASANFHASWTRENAKLYAEKAVNSAHLTGKHHLFDEPGLELVRAPISAGIVTKSLM